MRKNVIILIAVFLNLFFSLSAFAQLTLVSPKPGEGPVQIAERYHVDPAAFIKLNKKLGRFSDARKPSLVYTWQKFVIPDDAKKEKDVEAKSLSVIKRGVKKEEKLINKGFIGQESNLSAKSAVVSPVGLKTKSFKDKAFDMMKKITNVQFGDHTIEHAPMIVSILVFLFFICIAILINLTFRRIAMNKDESVVENKASQKPMFFVGFSEAFSGYCILPTNRTTHKIEIKSTISEISQVAAALCSEFESLGIEVTFGYDLRNNDEKWNILRDLKENEKNEFESMAREILNRNQADVYSGEDTSWSPRSK